MDDERIEELERVCERATPGPWVDYTDVYYEQCKKDRKQRGRWYHGTERESQPIALIASGILPGLGPIKPEHFPVRVSKYDLQNVLSLFWSHLPKNLKTVYNMGLFSRDAEFITTARTALPEALAEIKRLKAEVAALRDKITPP